MTDTPTILKSSNAADFLASLPTLAGYTAHDSLLVVPFEGNRTRGAMRLDLPAHDDTASHERLAAVVVGTLSRMPRCDGVILVVYVDQPFAVAGIAWESLWRQLDAAVESAGFHSLDALCVAADGWGSWHDPDVPPTGNPLSQIDESPLAAKAREVREGAEVEDFEAPATLPSALPALAARLTQAVVDLGDFGQERTGLGLYVDAPLPDGIDLVEQVIATPPDDVPVAALARLVVLSAVPAIRDQMMVQFAFGRKAGLTAQKMNARFRRRQLTSGLTVDELVARDVRKGKPVDRTSALVMGESATRPDVERVQAGIAVLRHAIAHVDPLDRPGPLCILAWLHWALGQGSVANRHISMARAIEPEHGMAQALHALFASGKLPEWVFSSWQLDDAESPASGIPALSAG
ncbi:MAG: DUF4192 family protein [Microbacterium sp.]|uniref:DUF4192 family protein n=1 Tax=Microbacterium sp. TaxID=51671 RepID=UPI0039E6D517